MKSNVRECYINLPLLHNIAYYSVMCSHALDQSGSVLNLCLQYPCGLDSNLVKFSLTAAGPLIKSATHWWHAAGPLIK